jgi:hypothetical protein
MKINFTKQEYRLLVTMLEIADWVMTANDIGENEEVKPYNELRKKILSYFKEMGMDDCYKYDKADDDYYETGEYEDNSESTRFIEKYNEEFFWQELIGKLADRDFHQKHGDKKVDMETRFSDITDFEEIYVNEITQNGLENLVIVHKEKSKLH